MPLAACLHDIVIVKILVLGFVVFFCIFVYQTFRSRTSDASAMRTGTNVIRSQWILCVLLAITHISTAQAEFELRKCRGFVLALAIA